MATTTNPIVTTKTTQNSKGTITTTVTQSTSTITNTTTVDQILGKAVTDVSYIPYMRKSDIAYVAYSMRPSREVWHFFGGKNVQQFIQKMNVIELDRKVSFKDFISGPRETANFLGSNTVVFLGENDSNGNTRLYVGEIDNPKTNVHVGNTIIGLVSGVVGNVVSYQHHSGYVGASSNLSYIYLSGDADRVTNNVYVGNTITFVTGPAAGQSSNIISYNAASQLAKVSPAFKTAIGNKSNAIYSIGDYRQPYSDNTVQGTYTTAKGFDLGVFHVPDPSANATYRWLTGDQLFRVIDNPRNDLNDYTTRADYNFVSNGLDVSTTQLVNRTISTNNITTITDSISNTFSAFPPPPPVVNPPVYPPNHGNHNNSSTNGGQNAGGHPTSLDPIAESFSIDSGLYPSGVFVASLTLFFKNKDANLPIQVQLRPMAGSLPSSSEILPGAVVLLQPEDVITTDTPSTANLASGTTFTFPSPVYLYPGQSYAFVVLTDSQNYDIYCAELGQTILGTNRIVSQQPFLGSMFKSQNASTYTPIQNDDIMFVMKKCVFSPNGSVTFNEYKKVNPTQTGNTLVDLVQVHSDTAQLPDTSVSFAFRATSSSNNALDPIYTSFLPEKNYLLDSQKIIYGEDIPTNSFYLQIAMATINEDVSPIIFKNRQQVVAITEQINNLSLTNAYVIVQNTGSGYYSSNTSLTFTANTGYGANGYIVANTNGGIDAVIMDSPGYGYSDDVSVTITSPSGTGGQITVLTETSISGGPAAFRYISETVTLQDGYDGGDLRVFLTAIKPSAASIDVYYKVRNSLDPVSIDDQSWVRMQQVTAAEFVSVNLNDPISYQYSPSVSSNNVTYSSTSGATYKTFNQFKIKIVGSSTGTTAEDIPSIQDMTAYALVADVY